MDQEPFGAYIRGQRERKGLSLRAAAKLLGIGHTRLSEFEKGVTYRSGAPTGPSRDLVETMARVYQVPKDALLETAGFKASRPGLTTHEAELLDLFRELPTPAQGHLIDVARSARSHFAIPASGK